MFLRHVLKGAGNGARKDTLFTHTRARARVKFLIASRLCVGFETLLLSVCDLSCLFTDVTPSQLSGYYTYHQVLTSKNFYVLPPTQYICVFCMDLRTNSDYFTMQH
jgi:hypothetical protein